MLFGVKYLEIQLQQASVAHDSRMLNMGVFFDLVDDPSERDFFSNSKTAFKALLICNTTQKLLYPYRSKGDMHKYLPICFRGECGLSLPYL